MLNIINLEEIYLKFIFLLLLPEIHIWGKKKKTNELVGKLRTDIGTAKGSGSRGRGAQGGE